MSVFKKILCPTDFSPFSRTALAYARSLAERYHATLYVQHVTETLPTTYYGAEILILQRQDLKAEIQAQARQALDAFIPVAARQRLSVVPLISEGKPYQEILHLAERESVDLLVLGTHGRSGLEKLFLGSVTEKVIRKAPCPVLTVRHDEQHENEAVGDIRFRQILVPIDFSPHAVKTLEYAQSLAEDYGFEIHVLHVVEGLPYSANMAMQPFYISDFTQDLVKMATEDLERAIPEAMRSRAQRIVRVGAPHQEIRRMAEQLRADLIVMGVSGRGALDTALFGSTTYRTIRSAACPVLAIR